MLRRTGLKKIVTCVLAALVNAPLFLQAYDGKPQPMVTTEKPKEIEGVGIDEKIGTYLDKEIEFRNELGEVVKLGSFFDGKTPTILSPVYFSCPGLCNFHLNGLTDGLKEMDWTAGGKFKVLAVSFDARENSELAAKKKQSYMKIYNRTGSENGWHFLTGSQDSIDKLTKAIGFKFRWNEEAQEWAHGSAAVVVSPLGEVTHYLPGIIFRGKDIKLALNDSSSGKIGNFAENLLLFCFKFDTQNHKFSLAAFRLVQVGGALIILLMAIWLLPVWFRSRKDEDHDELRSGR